MKLELTKDQEMLIDEQLATGRYGSRDEVIAEALALLSDCAQLEQLKLKRLRAEIQKGLDSGKSTPLDMRALKEEARRRNEHTRRCTLSPKTCTQTARG